MKKIKRVNKVYNLDVRIVDIIVETENVKSLVLEVPKEFFFYPGQFINASLYIDNELVTRSYSISSSPLDEGRIMITFRKEGKFTNALSSLKTGDLIHVKGPFGMFLLDTDLKQDIIFIAGGTGIAPLMSMIRYIHKINMSNRMTLFYSVRDRSEIIFYDELKSFDDLNLIITLTKSSWEGEEGRISEDMLTKHESDFENKMAYICGPKEMVKSMIEMLSSLGVKRENIWIERWS